MDALPPLEAEVRGQLRDGPITAGDQMPSSITLRPVHLASGLNQEPEQLHMAVPRPRMIAHHFRAMHFSTASRLLVDGFAQP